jgi:hypothetical protein
MSGHTMLRIISLLMVCSLHTISWCMEVKLSATSVTCYGGNDGEIKVSISNASSAYTIKLYDKTPAVKQKTLEVITTSDSIVQFVDLPAKKYFILVTDDKSNRFQGEIVVDEPGPFKYMGHQVDLFPTSSKANNGQITLVITGGTPPYSFKWNGDTKNQTTQTAKGLAYGIYSCEINDANKCGPLRPSIMFLEPDNE